MSTIVAEVARADMDDNLQHLLDSSTFVEFRDYYLRSGIVKFNLRHFPHSRKSEIPGRIEYTRIKKIRHTEYANQLEETLNTTLTSEQHEDLQKGILKARHNLECTPYDRVGQVLDLIKSLKPDVYIHKHSQLRYIMESMLLDWTCRDIHSKPLQKISEQGLNNGLVNLITKKNNISNLEWKTLWSLNRDAHIYEQQDENDKKPEQYYEDRKIIRNTLRKQSNNEEVLLTSRLFKNGYMYSNLSWARFQEFLEQQYVFTCNENTFDKQFFSEWLSGYNWSTSSNKEKYENLVTKGFQQWKLMIETLVEEQIDYLFPLVLTGSQPIYKLKYSSTDLDDAVRSNRIINYEELYKKLTIRLLDKHPVLYLYKDFLIFFNKHKTTASLTEDEIDKQMYEKYPKLQILNTLFNMNEQQYMSDEWHAEQQKLNLILIENENTSDLPNFEEGSFDLKT